jgi:hypothetical protein
MDKDKPDNVADEPGLLPYGSNIGAPSFTPDDLVVFKQNGASRVVEHLSAKMEEIRKQYEELMEEFDWNRVIYNSEFSFTPIQGKSYHLYKRTNGTTFLSILNPKESKFVDHRGYEHMGEFTFSTNESWIKNEESKF